MRAWKKISMSENENSNHMGPEKSVEHVKRSSTILHILTAACLPGS